MSSWNWGVSSPVTEEKLADPGAKEATTIQFSNALTDADYVRLGKWFADHPGKTLRVYGSVDSTITDLDFLQYFPTLRSFEVDGVYRSLTSIEGLNYLPDRVTHIGLGHTVKKLSLAPLAHFANLERLYLEGHTRDIEVIGDLRNLRSVTLRSITLPDLSLLVPHRNLRTLELKLGGTNNLQLLPELQSLDYLELWRVRGLSDLSPVAELPRLEYLVLQALGRVESLPRMNDLAGLRRLWIESL